MIEDAWWSMNLEVMGTSGPGALAWALSLSTLTKRAPAGSCTVAPPEKGDRAPPR